MSSQDYERLRAFFEERSVAIRAAKPLKKSAIIAIEIIGDDQAYHVTKESGQTRMIKGAAPKDPQVTFKISPQAIEKLIAVETEDIGEYGIAFFKLMLSKDPEISLAAKLHTGFIGLTRMGVFGILALGGGSVMSFLAREGLKGIKDIKRKISNMKG